jgi:hypothetical protein
MHTTRHNRITPALLTFCCPPDERDDPEHGDAPKSPGPWSHAPIGSLSTVSQELPTALVLTPPPITPTAPTAFVLTPTPIAQTAFAVPAPLSPRRQELHTKIKAKEAELEAAIAQDLFEIAEVGARLAFHAP